MNGRIASDLVIVGAGCAGLALAAALARAGHTGRVDLIERRQHYSDDRSWCFWEAEHHPLRHLVRARWPQWRVSVRDGDPVVRSLAGTAYQYIRGLDYYRHCLAAIAQAPNVHLHRGETVARLHGSTTAGEVITASGMRLTAPWIIDTRPPAADALPATLYQCFVGVELAVPGGHGLDPDTAGLMDNLRHWQGGVAFDYLLPLGGDRLLAEATCFTPRPVPAAMLERELAALLAQHRWSGAGVVRRERGVLPMGLALPAAGRESTIVAAGIAGGALRAATGYGFQRIQHWADRCARSLAAGGPPLRHRESAVTAAMDGLFLRVLTQRPDLGPALFEALFADGPAAAVIAFLTDRAGWRERLQVVTSLPARPFLAALAGRAPAAAHGADVQSLR